VVTSLLRFKIGIRTWRTIHWLAYAAWPLAAIHGIGAASDLQSGPLFAVVLATIAGVATAVAWRVHVATNVQPRRATARPVRA
jgi:sulfoxide reductase heme-binding subunit YedZ